MSSHPEDRLGAAGAGIEPASVVTRPFLLLTVATFFYFVGLASALPVLPRYLSDAGASEAQVGLVVGAFGITAILTRPIVGRLIDTRGRRPVMLAGAVVAGALLVLHTVSAAVPYLLAIRLVSGATEAAFFVAATTMVTDLAPEGRQGEAMSMFSVGVYLGLAAGPVLGETLYAAVGGAAFVGSAIASLLAATIAAFGVAEALGSQSASPPLSSLRGWARIGVVPSAFLPGAIILLVVIAQGVFNAFVPLLGEEIGLSSAGAAYAVFGVGVILIRIVGRTWPDRMPPALAAAGAITVAAVGLAIVGAAPGLVVLLIGAGVMSVGQALAFPVMSVIAVRRADPQQRGGALSTMTAFVDLSFTIAPILAGLIAQTVSLRAAFLTMAGVMALGLPLTLRLRHDKRPRVEAASVPLELRA